MSLTLLKVIFKLYFNIFKVSAAMDSPQRYDDKALLMSPKGWGVTSPTIKPISPTFFRGKVCMYIS